LSGQDRTQLPVVRAFGEELERAIARRERPQRRYQRRVLGVACATGLVAASLMTPPGRAASDLVGEWLGLAEPGDPPTVEGPRPRGELHEEPISSTVLASGRAPDGARYEFVLESFAEPPRSGSDDDFRHCLNIEWPDARVGQISPDFGCYPAFPPPILEQAVVKRGGAIFDPSRTTHVQVAGVARSDVSRLRILYKDEHGAKRDAPVDFTRVAGSVRKRAGADGAFGVFIGFLPPSWLGYGARYDPRRCPPEEHPYDPVALEVVAYDQTGRAIATERGNNINSWAGPPCPA
jgi:hypothetical protein